MRRYSEAARYIELKIPLANRSIEGPLMMDEILCGEIFGVMGKICFANQCRKSAPCDKKKGPVPYFDFGSFHWPFAGMKMKDCPLHHFNKIRPWLN